MNPSVKYFSYASINLHLSNCRYSLHFVLRELPTKNGFFINGRNKQNFTVMPILKGNSIASNDAFKCHTDVEVFTDVCLAE